MRFMKSGKGGSEKPVSSQGHGSVWDVVLVGMQCLLIVATGAVILMLYIVKSLYTAMNIGSLDTPMGRYKTLKGKPFLK